MGVPPIEQTRIELLEAWAKWDAAPTNRDRAQELEAAYDSHGSHLGLRAGPLRDLGISWRRAGFNRTEAIHAIEAGILAIRA